MESVMVHPATENHTAASAAMTTRSNRGELHGWCSGTGCGAVGPAETQAAAPSTAACSSRLGSMATRSMMCG